MNENACISYLLDSAKSELTKVALTIMNNNKISPSLMLYVLDSVKADLQQYKDCELNTVIAHFKNDTNRGTDDDKNM